MARYLGEILYKLLEGCVACRPLDAMYDERMVLCYLDSTIPRGRPHVTYMIWSSFLNRSPLMEKE